METIYRSAGTEGTCPNCGNGNAMLSNSYWSDEADCWVNSLKCRDCCYTVDNPNIVEVTYDELIKIKY